MYVVHVHVCMCIRVWSVCVCAYTHAGMCVHVIVCAHMCVATCHVTQ